MTGGRGAVFHGAGDDEAVPGSGHGHIEQARFLGEAFPQDGLANGVPAERGPAAEVVPVEALEAEALRLVEEGNLVEVLQIEPGPRAGEEDHREFKALALVDGHDAHRIGLHGRRGGLAQAGAAVGGLLQVGEEPVEAADGLLVPCAGRLVEGIEAGPAEGAVRKA